MATEIHSPLSVPECRHRLRNSLYTPERGAAACAAEKEPVMGWIDGDQVVAMRRTARRGFPPVFQGRLIPDPAGGTILQGIFRIQPFLRMILVVWLGFALWLAFSALMEGSALLSARMELPVGMVGVAILILLFAKVLGRSEEQLLVEFLALVVSDDEPGPVGGDEHEASSDPFR